LYFAASCAAVVLLRRSGARLARAELWFWRALAVVLCALGINKQLDLQTAFTEFGRILAREQGWYDMRGEVQRWFILCMALSSLGMTTLLAIVLRRLSGAAKLSLVGTASLLLFVFVRASSFHHVDSFLGTSAFGLRWNWILEVGGLLVIGLGLFLRLVPGAPRASGGLNRAAGGRRVVRELR
jgi:hypothetical protein